MLTFPYLGAVRVAVVGLTLLIGACAGPDDAAGENVDEVVALTPAEEALVSDARAVISGAAMPFEGKPNLLVALAPAAGSRLEALAVPELGDANLGAALQAGGASRRGAARLAGLLRNLSFHGVPSVPIFVLRASDGDAPIAIVVQTIDRIDECTVATLGVFDLDGTRLMKERDGLCT